MIFVVSWSITADKRDGVLNRFATEPDSSLKGASVIGRWHRMDGTGGYMVVEAESLHPVTEFTYAWRDLLFAEIVPVAKDADLQVVVSRIQARP